MVSFKVYFPSFLWWRGGFICYIKLCVVYLDFFAARSAVCYLLWGLVHPHGIPMRGDHFTCNFTSGGCVFGGGLTQTVNVNVHCSMRQFNRQLCTTNIPRYNQSFDHLP